MCLHKMADDKFEVSGKKDKAFMAGSQEHASGRSLSLTVPQTAQNISVSRLGYVLKTRLQACYSATA